MALTAGNTLSPITAFGHKEGIMTNILRRDFFAASRRRKGRWSVPGLRERTAINWRCDDNGAAHRFPFGVRVAIERPVVVVRAGGFDANLNHRLWMTVRGKNARRV
jgi:hypothetical protein